MPMPKPMGGDRRGGRCCRCQRFATRVPARWWRKGQGSRMSSAWPATLPGGGSLAGVGASLDTTMWMEDGGAFATTGQTLNDYSANPFFDENVGVLVRWDTRLECNASGVLLFDADDFRTPAQAADDVVNRATAWRTAIGPGRRLRWGIVLVGPDAAAALSLMRAPADATTVAGAASPWPTSGSAGLRAYMLEAVPLIHAAAIAAGLGLPEVFTANIESRGNTFDTAIYPAAIADARATSVEFAGTGQTLAQWNAARPAAMAPDDYLSTHPPRNNAGDPVNWGFFQRTAAIIDAAYLHALRVAIAEPVRATWRGIHVAEWQLVGYSRSSPTPSGRPQFAYDLGGFGDPSRGVDLQVPVNYSGPPIDDNYAVYNDPRGPTLANWQTFYNIPAGGDTRPVQIARVGAAYMVDSVRRCSRFAGTMPSISLTDPALPAAADRNPIIDELAAACVACSRMGSRGFYVFPPLYRDSQAARDMYLQLAQTIRGLQR